MRLNVRFAIRLLCCMLLIAALPACSQSRPADEGQTPSAAKPATSAEHNYARWEKDIAAFEAKDKEHFPPKGGILFIGSSTIRRWSTLETDFPNHRVINRGFGGSQICDSTYFAERIIFPYEPRMIFLRAGGNDIHAGKTPEQVFADYKAFVAKVHERLPKTQIVYISTAPTPSRWKEWDATRKLNRMVKDYTFWRPHLKYVETADTSLGPDGQPRPELFVSDRLHFNAEGYRLLAERVRPFLPK